MNLFLAMTSSPLLMGVISVFIAAIVSTVYGYFRLGRCAAA